MELINYGQICHDTSVLNNNGLLKISLIQPATRFKKIEIRFQHYDWHFTYNETCKLIYAMNTITAAIGCMSLYLVYGKHRALELFLILRSHYKMTTETGEDGRKDAENP